MIEKTFIPNDQIREIDALVSETMDCREGVLLDSYIAIDKSGNTFACIEKYQTAWTSGYTMITGDATDVWDAWNAFTENYDEEGEE